MRNSFMTFAIIILFCLCLYPMQHHLCYADEIEGEFFEVTEPVEFFNSDSDVLFKLPVSYYARKTGEMLSGDYYHVNYNNIDGMILKSSFQSAQSLTINDPYYTEDISINEANSFILVCNAPSMSADERLYKIPDDNIVFEFIGYLEDSNPDSDNIWYYVRYNTDQYGYLLSSDTNKPTLLEDMPPHPLSIEDEPDVPSVGDTPEVQEPTNSLLRVLLILGITVPAIIVVFLMFKPSNSKRPPRPSKRHYYDDDYYDYDDDYYDDYRYNRRDYRDRRR